MATRSVPPRKRGRKRSFTETDRINRRKEKDHERAKRKIYIGDNMDRWMMVKEERKLATHHEVAGFLLDKYFSIPQNVPPGETDTGSEPAAKVRKIISSTPLTKNTESSASFVPMETIPSGISEISSAESERSVKMSGIEELEKQITDDPLPGTSASNEPLGTRRKSKTLSSSFMDPFNLTIDVSEEMYEDLDDEEDPTFNITLGEHEMEELEDIAAADIVFGFADAKEDDTENVEDEEDAEILGTGVKVMRNEDDAESLLDDRCVIVYMEQMKTLAKISIENKCSVKKCQDPIDLKVTTTGSAVYFSWVCNSGHLKYKWCSQPVMNRNFHSGDLNISSSILLSGNNYAKMGLFAKFMNLVFPSCTSFNRIQKTYLLPAIEEKWTSQQTEIINEMKDEDVVLLGDGRMDSPGHCAQFCTYTLMENKTKKIVSVTTLDKRQTARKSSNMEKAGFIKGLTELQGKDMSVTEVATDQHLQIGAVMKRQFPAIHHSFDVWHVAKSLGKKILAAGQDKECKDLLPWHKDILNHFWHCCKEANTYNEFITIWGGVLHHVVNEHEWALSYGDMMFGQCSHGELEDRTEKPWIKKGSKSHVALRKIVLDKRFLNKVPHFLKFRSTSELENFHNHVLMYASKRFAYSPPAYRGRNLLAALDYNEHVDRPAQLKKDGSKRYHRTYNKKSERWSAYEVKVQKRYGHIRGMMKNILLKRLNDRVGMRRKEPLPMDDPRRIARHLAPTEPPSTQEIVESQVTRFAKD